MKKEYIKGNKTLTIQGVELDYVRFTFNNGKCVTNYFKPVAEYKMFLAYLLDVWFGVKHGTL